MPSAEVQAYEAESMGADMIRAAQAGHRESLNRLAILVGDRIRGYVVCRTRNRHVAEDIVQETLIAVWRSLGSFRSAERFWSWVFTIATNKARSYHRWQSRRRTVPMSALEAGLVETRTTSNDDASQGLCRAEARELTGTALKQISPDHRTILHLRFFEGMPYAGLARVLGCSHTNARVRTCRAKRELRRKLTPMGAADHLQ